MSESRGLGVVRAVICEDEPLARRAIQEYLKDVEWIEIVGTAADGKASLRLINQLDPDLVFLDVRMPGLNGLEVLNALADEPAVVFTTAFDEYAVSAFEHGAVDYLIKPFGRDRLLQTLDRVRVRLVGSGGVGDGVSGGRSGPFAERVFAKHRGAMVPVSVAEVIRIEAVDGGAELHANGQVFTLDSTLGEIEARLNPTDFVRVHRAHVANLARVRSIRKYDERRLVLTMEDDSSIVASRAGSQALRGLME